MTKVVYIGGFANGKRSISRVASALEKTYQQEVRAFTFSQAMDNPKAVANAVRDAHVITHSAGMLALEGATPSKITAFDAPLQSRRRHLLRRTGPKVIHMYTQGIGIKSPEDKRAVASYGRSAVAELAMHPRGNFGRLGEILHFDAFEAAARWQSSGVPTSLVYFGGDEYYQPSTDREEVARAAGVSVIRLAGGIHDELVIRPEQTLAALQAAITP